MIDEKIREVIAGAARSTGKRTTGCWRVLLPSLEKAKIWDLIDSYSRF